MTEQLFTGAAPIDNNSGDCLQFELDTPALSLAWSKDRLVYGHEQGVTILTRHKSTSNDDSNGFASEWTFVASQFHLGLSCELIATAGNYVATVHDDSTISLINLAEEDENGNAVETSPPKKGHWDFVNSVDVNSEGVVASVGDDRQLLISSAHDTHKIKLEGAGRYVKFQEDCGDHLVVLEGSNRLRVFDWRKLEFLYTVYSNDVVGGSKKIGCCGPPTAVKAVALANGSGDSDQLLVLGNGWWRKYLSRSLQGGGGHTVPHAQGELYGSRQLQNALVCTAGVGHAAVVSAKTTFFYTIGNEKGWEVPHVFVSGLHAAAARIEGDMVAVSSGKQLTLLRKAGNALEAK